MNRHSLREDPVYLKMPDCSVNMYADISNASCACDLLICQLAFLASKGWRDQMNIPFL